MDFAKLLTEWYLENRRALPWRDTHDPYQIWLSEIILQQTRVVQGLPYYLAFTKAFPKVDDLASADEQQVLKLWQGLGYYSRARNLHATAKVIAFERGGIFPDNYSDLLKLKGIGEYTAAAIASFSFGENVPVVDGNVFRVLSRVYNISSDITSAVSKKEFTALAAKLMEFSDPALFNQAIMEFGALQCIPRNPDCEICVMKHQCLAFKYGKVNELPVKSKKAKAKNRYFNYLIFSDANQNTIIRKRTEKDIWQNLYEFPLVETQVLMEPESFIPLITSDSEILSVGEMTSESITHKLSHQHLHIRFWKVKVRGELAAGLNSAQIRQYPFPIVLHNFVERAGI